MIFMYNQNNCFKQMHIERVQYVSSLQYVYCKEGITLKQLFNNASNTLSVFITIRRFKSENTFLNTLILYFSCLWKNRRCDATDFRMILTDHGVCYSFVNDYMSISSAGTYLNCSF